MNQLHINNLSVYYSRKVQALKDISLEVKKGKCLGIVGESGSGKSTLARVILGLQAYEEGKVTFEGNPIPPKKKKELTQYRRQVQMIFQDANSTLNPRLPIWKSLMEPLDNFKSFTPSFLKKSGRSQKEKAQELLEMVGLEKNMADRFPGELSGGQKQRVSIARALSLEPSMLVCDEPTASLDVTVQKHILELLKNLQQSTNMTILFISHDIRAVTFLCDELLVMKNGEIVDQFPIEALYDRARHDYTKGLIHTAALY